MISIRLMRKSAESAAIESEVEAAKERWMDFYLSLLQARIDSDSSDEKCERAARECAHLADECMSQYEKRWAE